MFLNYLTNSFTVDGEFREKDYRILDGIKRISNRLRTNSHLQEVFEKMQPYSKVSTDSKSIKNLEKKH